MSSVPLVATEFGAEFVWPGAMAHDRTDMWLRMYVSMDLIHAFSKFELYDREASKPVIATTVMPWKIGGDSGWWKFDLGRAEYGNLSAVANERLVFRLTCSSVDPLASSVYINSVCAWAQKGIG